MSDKPGIGSTSFKVHLRNVKSIVAIDKPFIPSGVSYPVRITKIHELNLWQRFKLWLGFTVKQKFELEVTGDPKLTQ